MCRVVKLMLCLLPAVGGVCHFRASAVSRCPSR